jgi:hypothetical protein
MVAWPAGHVVLGMIMALFCMAKATVRRKGWHGLTRWIPQALWWGWSAIQTLVSLAIIVFYPQLV